MERRVLNRISAWLLPLAAAWMGAAILAALYFGILSWAESPQHAVDLFLEDLWIVAPILLGFGVQVGLYTAVRRTRASGHGSAAGGGLMGAGGASSTVAMAACCAHHVADALPLLGLTAGAALLAQYRIPFMIVGLATNLLGIGVMTRQLRRLRAAMPSLTPALEAA